MVPNIYRTIFSNTLVLYLPLCILILNQILLNHLQQQGVNADVAPALLRGLPKIVGSDLGIDPAERKKNCSLTTKGKRPTFQSRKVTRPMLEGLTHHPPLEIRFTVLF